MQKLGYLKKETKGFSFFLENTCKSISEGILAEKLMNASVVIIGEVKTLFEGEI